MWRWLDRISLTPLILGAVLLGGAPFVPEPHLAEKLRMLAAGELSRPIDIFDLFLHGMLPLLVLLKLARMALAGSGGGSSS